MILKASKIPALETGFTDASIKNYFSTHMPTNTMTTITTSKTIEYTINLGYAPIE